MEKLAYVPDGGSTIEVADPTSISGSEPNKPYVDARFYSAPYTGPTTAADASGNLPNIYIMVKNKSGFSSTSNVGVGLVAGTYTLRLRTGDFDPTFVVVQGEWVDHEVEKGADGFFTVELTARTRPFLLMEGDSIKNCIALKWKSGCEAERGYQHWLGSALVMPQNAASREVSRGSAISTSAPYIVASAPKAAGPEAKQTLTVAGPHFAPEGLVTSGTLEGGRFLYPAYYRKFVPYGVTVRTLKLAGVETTEAAIKTFLAKKSLFRGTIQNDEGAAVEQTLTITARETGVLVDFNLSSFSAPNPTLYTSNPSRDRRTVSTGAAINPLRTAKKGQRLSRTALLGPSTETRIVAAVSRSSKVCKVSGSSIRMLKAGKCTLMVTITPTTTASTAPSKVSVSVTVS